MQKKLLIILITCSSFLASCSEGNKNSPLSFKEKERLVLLRSEVKQLELQRDEYKKEKSRIEELEKDYFQSSVTLDGFEIIKSDSFRDGLPRACYKGYIKNIGSENIETVTVSFKFYKENELLNTWETDIISTNDLLLSSDINFKYKRLILNKSGVKYPLRSNEIRYFKKGNCMSESFSGWDSRSVKYSVSHLKLRPKASEFDYIKLLEDNVELMKLEKRAVN